MNACSLPPRITLGTHSRPRLATLLALLQLLLLAPELMAQQREGSEDRKLTHVALLFDGPSELNQSLQQSFESEIRAHAGPNHPLAFDESHRVTAEWSAHSIEQLAKQLLDDPEVDLIIALGPGASQILGQQLSARKKGLAAAKKPVFCPFVLEPTLQNLPLLEHSSAQPGLSYLVLPFDVGRGLSAFAELMPLKHVAIVLPALLLELLPPLESALAQRFAELGLELSLVALPNKLDSDAFVDTLPSPLDGVYLAPLWPLDEEQQRALLAALAQRKIPTFAHFGLQLVERGALAGLFPESELDRIARRTAINVARALDGEEPGGFTVTLPQSSTRLTLNLETARLIGYRPTWAVLEQAELLHRESPSYDGRLSLRDAMLEVLQSPILEAERSNIALRQSELDELGSKRLPNVELGLNSRIIDADRATSFANEPQFKGSVYAQVEQVLYSDRVWTGIEQLERVVELEREDVASSQLDWQLSAATVYLNLLRARGLVRIREQNLRRSRSNLELARLRVDAGYANEADVYRWEILLIQSRQELAEASALEQKARVGLNLLLGRPAEALYEVEDLQLDSALLITSTPGLLERLADPWSFERFRDFLVDEAFELSPELRKLDQAVLIKQAESDQLYRSYWLPELGLQAGVSAHFLRAGAGSEPVEFDIEIPPPFDSMFPEKLIPDDLFPRPDAFEWFVGVGARWALWEGGARELALDRTQVELSQLHSQRAAVRIRIEQQLRSALLDAGVSYPKIASSQKAQVFAYQALDLVTDAYRNGAVTVAELVDAQNTVVTVEQAATIAVYDFVIDLLEVERALGRFSLEADAQARADWVRKLDARFEAEQAEPSP